MNYIWSAFLIFSFITGVISGRADFVLQEGLEGAKMAVETVISISGFLAFWSGILSVMEKGGVSEKIKKFLSPVLFKIFGKTKALSDISVNVTCNLLGFGNAATPAGIRAMETLDIENLKRKTPSRNMALFLIMNTASLQLIPTTVQSMRAGAGAKNPFDILVPVWITSFVSFLASLILVMILFKKND